MTIVSFNFTRIEAEKKDSGKGKVNINNNVTITNVEERDLSLGNQKQRVVRINFEFTANYKPEVGNIKLLGDVYYLEDAKKIKEIVDGWKKEKKLSKELMSRILTVILNKSNVQALILSEQINLPSPVPLPKVNVDQKQKLEATKK